MANMKLSSCILVLFLSVVSISGQPTNTVDCGCTPTTTSQPDETTTDIITNTTPNPTTVFITTTNPPEPGTQFVVDDVEFILHTRLAVEKLKYLDEVKASSSNLRKNKPVKVLVHGVFNDRDSPFNSLICEAFLKSEDLNLIVVDWSLGSRDGYKSAVSNVDKVGHRLAEFIDWLSKLLGIPIKSFHLIGHGLGAHLVGNAGRNVKSGQIKHITALDPSKMLYDNNNQSVGSKDAQYVEVIHTAIIRRGLQIPLGHTDFYPNKGYTQPGCKSNDVDCSHNRAYEFFADSIDHKGFMADQCTDYTEMADDKCAKLSKMYMGGSSPKLASGIFYLTTNAHKPYYQSPIE